MEYIIRKMNSKDINLISKLYNKLEEKMKSLQKEYMNLKRNITYEKNIDIKKYFLEIINVDDRIVFIVEIEKKIVGFMEACLNEKDCEFYLDNYCYIAYYYIEKEYRNFAIDIELYQKAELWAISKGIKYICSDVDGGNDVSMKVQKKFCGMKPFKTRLVKKIR